MSPRARRKRQWERLRGFGLGAAAVVCGAAVIWTLFGPAAVWLARHDIGAARGSVLETALQNARSAYLTLAAGILAAGALIYTARNHRLSREGQVTDRYTKAIEQLGSDKPGIRIGGIYALERIALDSARDHPIVMEVLSAYLREQSASPSPRGSLAMFLSEQSSSSGDATVAAPPSMPQDIRAAITVISRRDDSRDDFREHDGLDLEGVILARANLAGAILREANLRGADLREANLSNAHLRGALLRGADLRGAGLQNSDLRGADLPYVNLRGAHLQNADLRDARLQNADLRGAELNSVDLRGAKLIGADLRDVDMFDIDIHGKHVPDPDLRDANFHAARWSSFMTPPGGWQMRSDGRLLRVPPETRARPEDPDDHLPPSVPS